MMINHGAGETLAVVYPLMGVLLACMVCFMIGFRLFHTYSGVIRYSSFTDLIRVSMAVLVGLCLIALIESVSGLGSKWIGLEVVDIILMALFVIAFMWLIRI